MKLPKKIVLQFQARFVKIKFSVLPAMLHVIPVVNIEKQKLFGRLTMKNLVYLARFSVLSVFSFGCYVLYCTVYYHVRSSRQNETFLVAGS